LVSWCPTLDAPRSVGAATIMIIFKKFNQTTLDIFYIQVKKTLKNSKINRNNQTKTPKNHKT
jgi:hypothetical protein